MCLQETKEQKSLSAHVDFPRMYFSVSLFQKKKKIQT